MGNSLIRNPFSSYNPDFARRYGNQVESRLIGEHCSGSSAHRRRHLSGDYMEGVLKKEVLKKAPLSRRKIECPRRTTHRLRARRPLHDMEVDSEELRRRGEAGRVDSRKFRSDRHPAGPSSGKFRGHRDSKRKHGLGQANTDGRLRRDLHHADFSDYFDAVR